MAERETVAVSAFARRHDVQVFARSSTCLDTARDLARVMGDGHIIVSDDDGTSWRWESPVRSNSTDTKTREK